MTEYAVSRDGTRIGFTRRGSGPGIVLVQGAMATADAFSKLAEELASTFTVIAPDRRGRGMSPKPYDAGHDIARDVEDVDAVLAATEASRVFGLSSGAVITLEAALTLPRITAAAVYEPPFYVGGISHEGIRRLHAEIERGDWPSALVSALLTSGTAPVVLRRMPRPVARLLAAAVLTVDGRLRDLLPGVRYDFAVVAGRDGRLTTYANIDKPVLLLSGSKSPEFLRTAVRTLEKTLPRAQHVEFDGLDHSGSWNSGRPAVVAAALREFLS